LPTSRPASTIAAEGKVKGKAKTRPTHAAVKALPAPTPKPAPKPDKAAIEPVLPGQLTTTRDGEFCFTEEGFKATANAFRSGEGKHGIDDKTLVLLCQATGAFPLARDSNRGLVNSTTIQLMQSLAPRDGLEVLLCTQMIGLHNLSMEFARRASQRDQTGEGLDANVNRATRCTRAFVALTEALEAH
jgi:hypothetical protein